MKTQGFSFKTNLNKTCIQMNLKQTQAKMENEIARWVFEVPCTTISAMLSPFFPRWDHSMKLDQEHRRSMFQNVGQYSVYKDTKWIT